MDYKETIEKFAKGFQIHYDVEPPESPFFNPDSGLHLRPWGSGSDELNYWTSMHELGHAHTPTTMTEDDNFELYFYGSGGTNELHDEANAWLWAFDNSPIDPSDAARGLIALALTGYVQQDGFAKDESLCKVFRVVLASRVDTKTIETYLPQDYYAGAVRMWPEVKTKYEKV